MCAPAGRVVAAIVCVASWLVACGGSTPPGPEPNTPSTRETSQDDAEAKWLPPDDVLFSLRHKQSEVARCFNGVGAAVRGIARFEWVVENNGSVSQVELVESTTNLADVDECLREFVSNLHYSQRETPAKATWTFVRGLATRDVLSRSGARQQRNRKDRFTGAELDERSPGKLDATTIEDVAEHGFRLYAFCMRDGLNRDAKLSGRVLLSFTINQQGHVREVADVGSDLPDLGVIDCVAQSFYAMRFPKPDGGHLRLRYSILLNEE